MGIGASTLANSSSETETHSEVEEGQEAGVANQAGRATQGQAAAPLDHPGDPDPEQWDKAPPAGVGDAPHLRARQHRGPCISHRHISGTMSSRAFLGPCFQIELLPPPPGAVTPSLGPPSRAFPLQHALIWSLSQIPSGFQVLGALRSANSRSSISSRVAGHLGLQDSGLSVPRLSHSRSHHQTMNKEAQPLLQDPP